MGTEQKVTVGVPEKEGRRKSPRTTEAATPHVSLLDEASVMARTAALGSNVPVEQDGKVCAACVRDERVRDSWSMITGFLKDDRVKPPTHRRNKSAWGSCALTRVPLKHREKILMMHEITVCIVEVAMPRWFGVAQNVPWYDGLREWSSTSTGLSTDGGLDSRKGGTSVPLVGCAAESGMLSHLRAAVRVEAEMHSLYLPREN